MDLRRLLAVIVATGALTAAAVPASADKGPVACVVLASLADVNNVEMGPPSPNTNPMNPAAVGHANQKRGTGNRFGLYYPPLDPIAAHWQTTGSAPGHGTGLFPPFKGDHFNWKQVDSCDNGGSYNASGTGLGYCGRSVGLGTSAIGSHSGIIKWESAATQLVLTDPSAVGSVNAQANPPGSPNGSCLDGGAAQFTVDGVIVHN